MADWPPVLADENVHVAVVEGLRRRGFDIVAVHELRRKGYSDETHMTWALENRRIILTHDDDYLVLDGAGADHCGVPLLPSREIRDRWAHRGRHRWTRRVDIRARPAGGVPLTPQLDP
ncbi:MAG: DUF5615 family PIN-like protein [Dehalococcoidia bacterium]